MSRFVQESIAIPPLGLGMAPIGKHPEADAKAIVQVAWDGGARYYDTAPLYGGGLSESRAGRALKGRDRAAYMVSTKVGAYLDGERRYSDHSFDTTMRSFEESLGRLDLEMVDILYIHDPAERIDVALRGSYAAAERLRGEGRVGAVGVGVNTVEEGLAFVRESDISVLMLAGRYTLLDTSAERELLPRCLERGVQVVAAGVFNSGILTGRSKAFDYRPADDEIERRAALLRDVADRWAVPLGAVAMAFSRSHPAVTSIVVGASSAVQLREVLSWSRIEIPAGLWSELADYGLFRY